jgi:biotin operon repressor
VLALVQRLREHGVGVDRQKSAGRRFADPQHLRCDSRGTLRYRRDL